MSRWLTSSATLAVAVAATHTASGPPLLALQLGILLSSSASSSQQCCQRRGRFLLPTAFAAAARSCHVFTQCCNCAGGTVAARLCLPCGGVPCSASSSPAATSTQCL